MGNMATEHNLDSSAGSVLPGDRRALAAVATQFFVNGAVIASFVPRLPNIRNQLDLNLQQIGTILGIATLGGVLGSIIVGPLIRHYGTRKAMTLGSTVLVVSLPLVGFVNSPLQLALVIALIHAADVQTDVAMNLQGSALSSRRKSPVMNRLHGMWSVGTVVGGLVASAMASGGVSLRVHLVGAAVVLLAAVLWVIPGLRHDHDTPPEDISTGGAKGIRLVAIFAFLGAAAIIPEMVNSDWSAFRLVDDLGATEGVAGLAFVAFTTGMVLGRFGGDYAVARLGSQRLLLVSTTVTAVGVAIATLIPSVASAFVGLFVAGIGISVMYPQLYDNAARSPSAESALGGLTAGGRLALIGAPALVGALAQTDTVSVGGAIAIVTIPAALALAIFSLRQSAGGSSGRSLSAKTP